MAGACASMHVRATGSVPLNLDNLTKRHGQQAFEYAESGQ